KTRVLTERLRHLLGDRGIEPALVLAVAYNRKARDEMADRTTGLGARVETLNALGYGIVTRAWGRRPPLLEAREQRALVGSPAPTPGASSTTAATSLARGSTRSRSITGAPPRSSTLRVRCSRTTSVASTSRSDPRRMRRSTLPRCESASTRPTAARARSSKSC